MMNAENMSVEPIRGQAASGSDADLEFLAGLLDDRFQIPGTNVRFGLDAIIGLIPGVGDAISATLSSYLIWRAHQLGASKFTLLRMTGNMAVDTVVGAVPLIGDLFDMKFRANRRNVQLLRRQKLKQLPPEPRTFRRF
jgi:hypothetical protein